MTGVGSPDETPRLTQNVTATGGFAYGVIGADIHVFGDGTPLYVLENWRATVPPDHGWLRELPSRMLNARFEAVDFTGRTAELADLREWCGVGGPRLAVRWLHGPGGAGKSRLAARFAAEMAELGWKVIVATHGPGSVLPPPGSQDLSLDGRAGVLMIVDYADRWPQSHLTWLLSNSVLHRDGVTTRVLLIGRTADAWPAVRAALADHQASTSGQALAPLADGGDDRRTMFDAARDSFAQLYQLPDPSLVDTPVFLDSPDLGLVLALHMAALVAVDAHRNGRQAPSDPEALTVYLLDREHRHWADRFGDPAHRLELAPGGHLPPAVMNQTVFLASITGAVRPPAGVALLRQAFAPPDPDQVLADHALCYPPVDSSVVLTPLYPDRLAEDFLALTVPGHRADYPAQPWAVGVATGLLTREEGQAAPAVAARAVVVLTAAAARWPHVGAKLLYPLLRTDPLLALDAGSVALTTLAAIDEVDLDLLAAIETEFPPRQHVDLDPGIAAVAERLTRHRLAQTDDVTQRAELYQALAVRQSRAGLDDRALRNAEQAVALLRTVRDGSIETDLSLAHALRDLGHLLSSEERNLEAVAAVQEAVDRFRALSRDNRGRLFEYAGALAVLAGLLHVVGRLAESVATARLAVAIHRRVVAAAPHVESARIELSVALGVLSSALATMDHHDEAGFAAREVLSLRAAAAQRDPSAYSTEHAHALRGLGRRLADAGQQQEALTAAAEAVEIFRRAAASNPAGHGLTLAQSLMDLGIRFAAAGHPAEAVDRQLEAIAIVRRLARTTSAVSEVHVARGLSQHADLLNDLGRRQQAIDVAREAAALRHEHGDDPRSLYRLSIMLAASGQDDEALAANEEAVRLIRERGITEQTDWDDLAGVLEGYASRLGDAGRPEEARQAGNEAIRIRRQRLDDHPGLNEHELVTSLSNHSSRLWQLGRTDEALDIAAEAVAIGRRVSAAHPAQFARALQVRGAGLSRVDRQAEALPYFAEAATILQRLAEQIPDRFAEDHANALTDLARCQRDLDQPESAIATTDEAVRPGRHIADAMAEQSGHAETADDAELAVLRPPMSEAEELDVALRARLGQATDDPPSILDDEVAELVRRRSAMLSSGDLDTALLLATVAWQRHGQRPDGADLERAKNWFGRVFPHMPGRVPAELRAGMAATVPRAGDDPIAWYDEAARLMSVELTVHDDRVAERVISLLEDVVAAPGGPGLDRARSLGVLGIACRTRFRRPETVAYLDRSISAFHEAISLYPDGSDGRRSLTGPMLTSLSYRVQCPTTDAELHDLVRMSRELVRAIGADEPLRAGSFACARMIFTHVFERFHVSADLDEAIKCGRAVLTSPATPDFHVAYQMEALADLLRTRFLQSGAAADGDEAVALARKACERTPADDPGRPVRLTLLALSLQARFERDHGESDLDGAVDAFRSALAALPADHGKRWIALGNLGEAVLARTRDAVPDVARDAAHEAVALLELALANAPADHPHLAEIRANLASAQQYLAEHQPPDDARSDTESGPSDADETMRGRRSRDELYQAVRARAIAVTADGQIGHDELDAALGPDTQAELVALARLVESDLAQRPTTRDDLLAGFMMGTLHFVRHANTGDAVDLASALRWFGLVFQADPTVVPETVRGMVADTAPPAGDDPSQWAAEAERMLGLAQQDSFPQFVDRAIRLYERAIASPPDDRTLAGWLDRLAEARYLLWRRTGQPSDLDRHVDDLRRAIAATTHGRADRSARLNRLAGELIHRFTLTEDPRDVNEAVDIAERVMESSAEDDPQRARYVYTLGRAYKHRFGSTRQLSDVDAAIRALRLARDQTPAGSRLWTLRLEDLAGALRDRGTVTGEVSDLDQAIEVYDEIVEAMPAGTEGRSRYLRDVTDTWSQRYALSQHPVDLRRTIETGQQALAAADDDPLDEGSVARTFALISTGLWVRYATTGDTATLDGAVDIRRRILATMPPGHPRRIIYVSLLAQILRIRFEATGDLVDLPEWVAAARELAAATPADDLARIGRLADLSSVLLITFEHTDELAELDDAIEAAREAVRGTKSDAVDRPGRLRHLARAHQLRFNRTEDRADLDAAIEVGRQAADATTEQGQLRSVLSDLTVALRQRGGLTGDIADLAEADQLHQRLPDSGAMPVAEVEDELRAAVRTVEALPTDSPGRATTLAELSGMWLRRADATGSADDLDRAVEAGRRAVDAGQPAAALHLAHLSVCLLRRGVRRTNAEDIDEAVRLVEQAVKSLPPNDHNVRPGYLVDLGNAYLVRRGGVDDLDRAIDAFAEAVDVTTKRLPQHRRYANALVAALRERYEHTFDLADIDRAIEVAGRALAAPAGGPDTRGHCLANLSAAWRLRFERTGERRALDQAVEYGQQAVAAAEPGDAVAASTLEEARREQHRWSRVGSGEVE